MSFEEFDKKVREAAEHHHPSYDENAWKGMRKLLDKHLPEEDKGRRRIFFMLLLALLIGGGAFLLLNRSGENQLATSRSQTVPAAGREKMAPGSSEPDGSANNNLVADKKNNPVTDSGQVNLPVAGETIVPANKPLTIPGDPQKYQALKKNLPGNNSRVNTSPVVTKNNRPDKPGSMQPATVKKTNEASNKPNTKVSTDVSTGDDKKNSISNKTAAADLPVTARQAPSLSENKQDAVSREQKVASPPEVKKPLEQEKAAESPVLPTAVSSPKKKRQQAVRNRFSFTVSAGPDVSYAAGEPWGKTKLVLGLGLGYSIGERLMIRSGFFTASKIYDASPKSYNPPANFYTYYPYLYGVNADCRVYEIPLLVSYRFGKSSTHKGLLTAGLSSYIMKRETYDYTYSYVPSGPLYKHSYTMNNEHSHWLSVLTLSGGYQWQAGKNISLMAEPYLKLPLSGVGFGKVKLNSAGVLFTVGINPFTKEAGGKKRKTGSK